MDIGEKSCLAFSEVIARAKVIVWNGPMGVFEFEKFAGGKKALEFEMLSLLATLKLSK